MTTDPRSLPSPSSRNGIDQRVNRAGAGAALRRMTGAALPVKMANLQRRGNLRDLDRRVVLPVPAKPNSRSFFCRGEVKPTAAAFERCLVVATHRSLAPHPAGIPQYNPARHVIVSRKQTRCKWRRDRKADCDPLGGSRSGKARGGEGLVALLESGRDIDNYRL